MAGLLIGDVAEQSGVGAPTIWYYESIKLLAPPLRSTAGYRRYSSATVQELEGRDGPDGAKSFTLSFPIR